MRLSTEGIKEIRGIHVKRKHEGQWKCKVSAVAHPLGNRCPKRGNPTYTRTVDRIRTRALGDPSDPKSRMMPLYHGGHLVLFQ
ncbi:hypothetical protein E2C01_073463 [Portunus trituberculatus]|uniref:Uncharacterized protein n=1 Tax=Portunus trituberculatus TaxID=210409 RepID=A0A5B7IE05_PORTR|nr:hypothetical protein [Portunus trituberculatus]